MKILSIDVGIKNLAFCLLEKQVKEATEMSLEYKIVSWDSISLLNQNSCQLCDKPAKFCKDGDFYCRKHAKTIEQYQVPSASDLNLKRLSRDRLEEYIKTNDISLDILKQPKKCVKRVTILEELERYNKTRFFDPVKEDNAGLVSLIEIGINLQRRLDEILTGEKLDMILIENQLSSIAVRMKTLQGMLTQYFIMRGYKSIEYIGSQNKLKLFMDKDNKDNKDNKTTYSDRKRLGIQYCRGVLVEKNWDDWLKFMEAHAKRDDLADCFLQGLWWINKNI
jgi:hypothetical protein